MQIVTGSDDRYAIGVMTLLHSLWLHNPQAEVTVLDCGISEPKLAQLRGIAADHNARLHIIAVDAGLFAGLPAMACYISSATYLRLLIADLLPNAERALYLDSDMLVLGDLSELYHQEFGGSLCAAVVDGLPMDREMAALGIGPDAYVNAGMLLINLTAWRAEGVRERAFAFLNDPVRVYFCADQSAVNAMCHGRITYVSARWNALLLVLTSRPWPQSQSGEQGQPVILHYAGPEKPWQVSGPLSAIWQAYHQTIAPANRPDIGPVPKPYAEDALPKRFDRWRRHIMGVWLRKPKYLNRREAARWQREFQDHALSRLPRKA